MYARRKGWPLEDVTVNLRHAKIHASDCAECEMKEGMLDRIERDILIAGSLTKEQRSKLLEIANKCPVHRTLTSEIVIKTRAVRDDQLLLLEYPLDLVAGCFVSKAPPRRDEQG
jgi:uncharacterized OsmC-like protein